MAPSQPLPLFLIALGVLLLISPVMTFQANFGEPTWEYGAVEIEVVDDELILPDANEIPGRVFIGNIVCTDEIRSCALERYIRDQGELAVDELSFHRVPYEYVLLDGQMFEVTARVTDGTAYLTHEPVDTVTALRRSSVAYNRTHPAYRAAIEDGTTTSDTWLETPQVITKNPERPDEQYFFIYEIRSPSPGQLAPTVVQRGMRWLIAIAGFVIGMVLVLYGQRMRVTRQAWFDKGFR